MKLKFRYTFKPGEFLQATKDAYDPIAEAATAAMRDVAEEAQFLGRASIAAAGFSRKWQSALRFTVYPKRKASASPSAVIYSKVPYAGVFEEGATIAGKPLLWLSLPDAPRGRGGKKIPASEYRQFVGHPLYTIRRPGKTPLLGAVIRQTSKRAEKGVSLSQLRRGRNPGGRGKEQLVPLYFGAPLAKIGKKFAVEQAAKTAFAGFPSFYYRHFVGY
jgi:hypothetical protein